MNHEHQHHPTAETIRPNAAVTDRGFSLNELVMVVAILGLLASIVVIAVGGLRADAADANCGSDRRALAVAAEAYHAQNGPEPVPATGTGHDRYERTLVDAGLLRAVSTIHDLDASGVVQPEGNSPC